MREVGGADCDLRRLEDYEWFIRIGLSGFELKVQNLVAAGIERGSNTNFAAVTVAANAIRQRIRALTTSKRLRRTAAAYLFYEQAASAWREGRFPAFGTLMMASLAAQPRLTIIPMPGWHVHPAPKLALLL
ncbi:hypothetical protein [Rhizobium sp. F40D2]|uniref:hypothetical protein n=1 Tax=Rhizobium sp. F40D2 TaxID=3453141 RepID=UPI003F2693BB